MKIKVKRQEPRKARKLVVLGMVLRDVDCTMRHRANRRERERNSIRVILKDWEG